ncbi:gliding motility regulatory protein FrzE [Methyloglobulus morosus KoM1]|uniref:Chemotaxis protein CheA n=1 Tax=Methyloglobulus morosus KoM1 TaxID=1116472 RepID=V5BRI6_9GAMM|nr:response regulator [Methyloglobulus morosus]ESS67173.1 gliding motility regulatory protein FrzE [Methyloglobulus morosus KoM1]
MKKPDLNELGNLAAYFERLADQAAQRGCYGLQDANLVLAEAVRVLQSDNPASNNLFPLVGEWFDLVEKFTQAPKQTASEMTTYLRRPELNIPMEDEEFAMLGEQLLNDANAAALSPNEASDITVARTTPSIAEQHITDEQVAYIEQLANQAAAEGLYGLQDVNLLLAETLRELSGDAIVDSGLISALSGWHDLLVDYRKEPRVKAEALINFLRHPGLKIPMGDDEFAMLQEQLTTEAEANVTAQEQVVDIQAVESIPEGDPSSDKNSLSGVSRIAQELVDLLLMQIGQIRDYLQSITIGNNESLLDSLQEVGDDLERFSNMAKTAGFGGLSQVATHVTGNVQSFQASIEGFTTERLDLLLDWTGQVQEYLPSFNDSDAGQLILVGLTDEQWPMPLPFEEMVAILQQIRAESSVVGEDPVLTRMEKATDEDISLVLPGDVNQELLEILLQELPIQTQQFSEAVQRLHAGGSEQDVQLAQRVAHTLKGSANTVGIKGIAVLTHQLEDILLACANEQKLPNRALANSLINAADCLESMSESLLGVSPPPSDAKVILQEILDWANLIDKVGLPERDDETTSPVAQERGVTESEETDSPSQLQATMIRVTSEQIEELFRFSGESIILNSQASDSMRRMKKQMHAMKVQFSLLQELGAELEQLIDLKDLTGRSFGVVDTNFDVLEMDQYNELHTASRRMAEAAIDARELSLDVTKELDRVSEILESQQRMVVDTQEVVMQTRLVAISTIAPRLQRSIRQTCRMTGKQSELTVKGDTIMIDGDVLNALVDPMMHILRNAVDHGIESPDERRAHGKPPVGQIAFEFDREGNNILVRCRDDGKGLDYEAIRAAAESRGLLQSGQDVTDEELKSLIMRPNFSSRTVSTQTSGRGVGMDVVRAQILNMGGTLNLHSVQGQGMTIELRVPLPLSMTYALLTYVGHYRVAVANKGINQIVYSKEGEVILEGNKETLLLEGVIYPVARLIDLLHIADHRKIPRPYDAILLVQNENQTTAVLLDAIFDSLEVVIKGLGRYLGKVPGYIGATILGDGTVTPVVDIPELLRAPVRVLTGDYVAPVEMADPTLNLPTVLVVDDSLSQRRALEQLLADAGYRVRSARDGIEATDILAHFKPDVVLTDLEMPRMNGIELTAHIRSHANTSSLPVIMVTSRTTQKHKKMAEDAGVNAYITKPVREEDLLTEMENLMAQQTGNVQAQNIAQLS